MATPTRFWDRIADRYSKSPIADEDAYQKKLDVTRRHFTPESEVLELGCGTGGTALLHAPHVKHYRATDVSKRMIEIAEGKKSEGSYENVSFEQASLEGIDVADASVDVVLTMSLLHLLDDREPAIRRVYDMLKPGGVFVSSTACLGDHMKWFRFIGPIGRSIGLMPLVRVFSRQELLDSITQAGFEIDYEWRPGKGKAVFVVAKKPDTRVET
ncbi:MAG: methyltransferase domain-containing protein [Woeseiaceae bacterium]|nr:methyltransferase domain-containing protein [Woeseiaceae bacterium]